MSSSFLQKSDLKNLPIPVRWLIRPALFLSVGLHLLLLLLPLLPDSPSKQAEAEPEETEVALTPLPIEPTAAPKPAAVVPSPAPSVAPFPVPSSPPTPSLNRIPPAATQPPPAVPTVPQPSPSVPATPASQSSPQASPQTSTQLSNSPTPAASPLPPQNHIVAPFASFPHMANAQPGCFNQSAGDCRQVAGNFRQVSQALTDQLRGQGYAVKQRDDLEETGRQVYEVTKDSTTRYLSVISSDLAGTAYILANEPVTQADIEQIGTVQTQLQTLLNNLAEGSTATSAQFAYPESFFTGGQPRPEMSGPSYLVSDAKPAQLVDRLTSTLETNGFQASPIGEYGGGPVYEVGQKAFLGYVNLVPTQDGRGTIVVLWQRVPEG